jgi:hypothetical protein
MCHIVCAPPSEDGLPHNHIVDVIPPGEGFQGSREEMDANADLVKAAFNMAHEARKMGYDPQAVIEKLPEILRWAETALDEAEFTDEGETPRRTPPSPSTLINLRNAMIEARGDDN